jgi:tetratricopeptide (TPR) repeat protein
VLAWRRLPVVAFGILFYYLAHTVESSVIPIRDVVFEHRAYLPDLGLCLAAAWLLVVELPRSRAGARAAWVIVPALLLALGTVTWRRNEVWRDPIALWRDNVALAPTKARAWGVLGRYLLEANRPDEGARALREAIRLRAESGDVGSGSDAVLESINMIWALRLLGRYDEALALNAASTQNPMPPELRAKFYINEGSVYFDERRVADAEAAFRNALALAPHSLPALTNLASTLAQTGRLAEAESLMVEALRVDPGDRNTRFNLCEVRAERRLASGEELRHAGRTTEALTEYHGALAALEEAARLAPGDSTTAQNARKVASMIEALEAGRR